MFVGVRATTIGTVYMGVLMNDQITYEADTVKEIQATLERGATIIEYLVGIINRGETLNSEDIAWLEAKWGADIMECIKRLETEGRYV